MQRALDHLIAEIAFDVLTRSPLQHFAGVLLDELDGKAGRHYRPFLVCAGRRLVEVEAKSFNCDMLIERRNCWALGNVAPCEAAANSLCWDFERAGLIDR